MDWLLSQLEEIRENPRLRLGVWAVLGILLLYLVLVLSDLRTATRDESRQLADRLARLERVSEQGDWPLRAEEARGRRVNLEEGLWSSSSRGLAQAEFESWVLERSKASGLSQVKATTDSPVAVDAVPGAWTVNTELDLEFEPRALYGFLRSVEGHDKLVVVSRLDAGARGSRRASMTLRGYYRIGDAG